MATVIGIGTGRSGTMSLATLLDAQPGAKVTHERAPVLPWVVDEQLLAERLHDLAASVGWLGGDVAYSYLPYVSLLLERVEGLRVVCVLRDRDETIASFERWVGQRNHWSAHDGTRWELDPPWDRTFPTYMLDDRPEAIGAYWDEYRATVEALARSHPEQVGVWWIPQAFDEEGIEQILDFVGVLPLQRVRPLDVRRNSLRERLA